MEAAAPDTPGTRFKLALGLVCLVLIAIAGLMLRAGNWLPALVPALAIVGLVRRVRWGRVLAVILFWLLLLVGVSFALPQAEFDQITGSQPQPLEVALAKFAACVTTALIGLHLLGRFKKEFRPGRF